MPKLTKLRSKASSEQVRFHPVLEKALTSSQLVQEKALIKSQCVMKKAIPRSQTNEDILIIEKQEIKKTAPCSTAYPENYTKPNLRVKNTDSTGAELRDQHMSEKNSRARFAFFGTSAPRNNPNPTNARGHSSVPSKFRKNVVI